MRRLYVLTAPRGAGKTTFCRTLAERARSRGWTVVGVLSPAVFEEGVKTGIEVLARREFPSARVITLPANAGRQRLTIDD